MHMTHSAASSATGVQGPAASVPAPSQPGAPWWRVSWSVPAAVRALRATIVIPCLLALTFEVLHDEQMAVFAVFGGFGTLVLTSFGGTRRDKALAHLGLALAGSVAVVLGTLASGSTWLAALVALPVSLAVFFGRSAPPTVPSRLTAFLLPFVPPLPSPPAGPPLPHP